MQELEPHLGQETYRGPRPPVSVVVLTHNEEVNVGECLDACAWCDDVHVLDSGSTDRTRQIAEEMGVPVHHHPFRNFGEQRNWAIDHIAAKHPWQFHIDADERFTAAIVREIAERIGPEGEGTAAAAFLVPGKLIFFNRWLKHSGQYPTYQVRLFRPDHCRFVADGHGQREDTTGPLGVLQQPYLHFSFNKGLFEWFTRHNRYSQQEADEMWAAAEQGGIDWAALLGKDVTRRRRALKRLAYNLPGRFFWRFVYNYFARLGLIDGMPGLHYAIMISIYEHWTEMKVTEYRVREKHRTGSVVSRLLRGNQTMTQLIDRLIRNAEAESQYPVVRSPLGIFFREFIFRGGLLRGRLGLYEAMLLSQEAYMARLLHRERQLKSKWQKRAPT